MYRDRARFLMARGADPARGRVLRNTAVGLEPDHNSKIVRQTANLGRWMPDRVELIVAFTFVMVLMAGAWAVGLRYTSQAQRDLIAQQAAHGQINERTYAVCVRLGAKHLEPIVDALTPRPSDGHVTPLGFGWIRKGEHPLVDMSRAEAIASFSVYLGKVAKDDRPTTLDRFIEATAAIHEPTLRGAIERLTEFPEKLRSWIAVGPAGDVRSVVESLNSILATGGSAGLRAEIDGAVQRHPAKLENRKAAPLQKQSRPPLTQPQHGGADRRNGGARPRQEFKRST
jgi:hypothetical protein